MKLHSGSVIAVITRGHVWVVKSSTLWNLTKAVCRSEQMTHIWMQQLRGFTQSGSKRPATPSWNQSTLWVLSRVIMSYGWAEMSQKIVHTNGSWKRSSQTSRKLWNNFIRDVGNIFNTNSRRCYLFCQSCKVTWSKIYQNKDIVSGAYRCSFFAFSSSSHIVP